MTSSALLAFQGRADLVRYGSSGLGLFALQIRFSIEDIESVAADCLTDFGNDRKCDICYIDQPSKTAVIIQVFNSPKERSEAPTKKATDLNTAATWLFAAPIDQLQNRLRDRASELREMITNGSIRTIELWYAHKHPESINVQNELHALKNTAHSLIATHLRPPEAVEIKTYEVGDDTLNGWYETLNAPILVSDTFEIEINGGYETRSTSWSSYSTTIPATWLHEQFKNHGKKLFSANIRDYLGSTKQESNVNNGIRHWIKQSPENFWAYNNGLSALVNGHSVVSRDGKTFLRLEGLSIVNGAQTTGAIGNLPQAPDPEARLPARFITCTSDDIVRRIVRFNNSQNKLAAADFRSTDAVQARLRREFTRYLPSLIYNGGRRGGSNDAIPRPGQRQLFSDTVAQALTAFHQNPTLAYSRKGDIWENDTNYSAVFNESTHAQHILFAYSLYAELKERKLALVNKARNGEQLTNPETERLDFFELRGSIFMIEAAVAHCLDVFIGSPIPSKFDLRFKAASSLDDARAAWAPVLDCCLPFHSTLRAIWESKASNRAELTAAFRQFSSLVEATREPNRSAYDSFTKLLTVEQWPMDPSPDDWETVF